MKVSIIVPVYNVEKYLAQCVDSIISQTYKDIEVILVDDGSKDGSPDICDNYQKLDPRIKVIHKENGGLSDARNFGIEAASGDYLIFVDSDDYWNSPMLLEKCVNRGESLDADVTLFGFTKYYQDTGKSEIIDMNVSKEVCETTMSIENLLKDNVFTTSACNKLIKSSFFRGEEGIRFVKGQLSEDIEYCAQILMKAQSYAVVNENFYVYRQGRTESISANIKIKNISDITNVLKKYSSGKLLCNKNLVSRPLLNYLALQYILLLTISNLLPDSEIANELKDMKSMWWLTKFTWCPYVKKVSAIRWLGFSIVRKSLGLYKKIK